MCNQQGGHMIEPEYDYDYGEDKDEPVELSPDWLNPDIEDQNDQHDSRNFDNS